MLFDEATIPHPQYARISCVESFAGRYRGLRIWLSLRVLGAFTGMA